MSLLAPQRNSKRPSDRRGSHRNLYGNTRYWDEHYQREKGQFDWYQRWGDLENFMTRHLKKEHSVLIVGCGNSRMGEKMFDSGYQLITSVDISHVVIKQMTKLYALTRPALRFLHMNACALEFPDESYDAVIAKATMDIIMCSEGAAGNISKMCRETSRVLRPGGVFIVISIDENHMQHLCPEPANDEYGWSVKREVVPKPVLKANLSSGRHSEPLQVHYVYVCRKGSKKG